MLINLTCLPRQTTGYNYRLLVEIWVNFFDRKRTGKLAGNSSKTFEVMSGNGNVRIAAVTVDVISPHIRGTSYTEFCVIPTE